MSVSYGKTVATWKTTRFLEKYRKTVFYYQEALPVTCQILIPNFNTNLKPNFNTNLIAQISCIKFWLTFWTLLTPRHIQLSLTFHTVVNCNKFSGWGNFLSVSNKKMKLTNIPVVGSVQFDWFVLADQNSLLELDRAQAVVDRGRAAFLVALEEAQRAESGAFPAGESNPSGA